MIVLHLGGMSRAGAERQEAVTVTGDPPVSATSLLEPRVVAADTIRRQSSEPTVGAQRTESVDGTRAAPLTCGYR